MLQLATKLLERPILNRQNGQSQLISFDLWFISFFKPY